MQSSEWERKKNEKKKSCALPGEHEQHISAKIKTESWLVSAAPTLPSGTTVCVTNHTRQGRSFLFTVKFKFNTNPDKTPGVEMARNKSEESQ